jgi:hypothetical protein
MAFKFPVINFKDKRFTDWFSRSGYFMGAVLFHLIIFIMVATWVIFPAFHPPTDEFKQTYLPPSAPPPPPPPVTETMPVPTHSVAPPTPVISSSSAAAATFSIPLPDLTPATSVDTKESAKMTAPPVKVENNLASRLPAIRATVMGWGRSRENILESDGDPHNVVAKFPVYVASYADGDWACNLVIADGKIIAGSIPNLVEKINQWSKGNIKAEVIAQPLAVGGPDLLSTKPPFIFFTGHKDFTLTPQEVKNLQDYLQDGGAIWGDNSLAGEGSRFDVAFRREMKRVVPDKDKNFEPMGLDHDLYTKSWFNITKEPSGMNYYAEPVQHIDIDGKVAILYTTNDYSDMMFMRILPGDKAMDGFFRITPTHPLVTSFPLAVNAHIFFRNFQFDSCLAVHQLGMNIIGFLLVRFDKDLILSN